jgi:hypothetical protein
MAISSTTKRTMFCMTEWPVQNSLQGVCSHSGDIQTEAALASVERRATAPIQPLLFQVPTKERPWKSLRSVSRKRAQRNSSAR